MALKNRYKKQIIEIIHKHIPKCDIYLFGSRATDTEKKESDIDMALDAGHSISYEKIIKILIDLDDTTIPMTVDVVDLSSVSKELKFNILSEGIRW